MFIPDSCFSLNKVTINPKTGIGEVIIIRALEKGYYKTNIFATQEQVDDMNLHPACGEGIFDLNTVKAMETASIFGWDTYKKSLEVFSKSTK